MNIADELKKLADLRAQGIINEREFEIGKRKILYDSPVPQGTRDNHAPIVKILPQPVTFIASRWTTGNLCFPDMLTVDNDAISYKKSAIVGSKEEHINYKSVASVKLKTGMVFADLIIETSGGSQSIIIHGLSKQDAQTASELIRKVQEQGGLG
jgi:Short C-terminal domain/Bacterial PH domain